MGFVARALAFARVIRNGAQANELQVDLGGGDIRTADHFSAPGDDSFPLKTDYAGCSTQVGSGRTQVLGYVDPLSQPKAQEGDKRIYARDPTTGASVVELWLKSDGSAELTNSLGSIILNSNGSVNINGATIGVDGSITSPTSVAAPSVLANSKELAGHAHLAGTPPGNTGPNL